MKKNLFLRTDTLPEEIPIQFTNKNVYLNFTEKKIYEYNNLAKNKKSVFMNYVTVPHYFYIPKNNTEKRRMSLIHPIAQLQIFNYILKYEQLILSFCSNTEFSVRSPIKRNYPKTTEQKLKEYKYKKIEEEFKFDNKLSTTSEEDEVYFYTYFSYKKYKRITNLYNSPKFNRDKYKYKYFLKLDIQHFYPSIYTHALSWAIFGDKSLAKKYKTDPNLFANATDKIMQNINFGETNGIVIGPEFSRVIAEILLSRIDNELLLSLNDNHLHHKKDYSLYRYADDFFLFSHKKEDIQLIKLKLQNILAKYNLKLNENKSELQQKPFSITNKAISDLKRNIKDFELDTLMLEIKHHLQIINHSSKSSYKTKIYQWNDLFFKMEQLIVKYPDSTTRIVNYFLQAIRTHINCENEHRFVLSQILEVVTNVYTLDINYKSTNYLIAIYIKIYKHSETLKKETIEQLRNEADSEKIKKLNNRINNIDFIHEKIFYHIFTVLKNNFHQINDMYELLIFSKILPKELPAQFLSRIIMDDNSSYFTICSTAYYILNEELNDINQCYKTVQTKILDLIDVKIKSYSPQGAKYSILESDYFYYLNDFSKYPGFNDTIRHSYKKLLEEEYNKTLESDTRTYSDIYNSQKEMWISITKYPYFQWNLKNKDFIRKIIKKSICTHNMEPTSEY